MKYEITVELPNGDWVWTHYVASGGYKNDYHAMLDYALEFAFNQGGRVHHIEKLG